MAARWSAEERKNFRSLLSDGVELNILKKHFPSRSNDALHREAQKYGYGVKTVQGVKVLYFGKKTRNRKKKADDTSASNEATDTIVGEKRTATNSSTPTTLESLDSLSDSIIPEDYEDSAKSTIIDIYLELDELLNDERFPLLQSLSVTLICGSSVCISKHSKQ